MPNPVERAHCIAEEMTHGDIRGAANELNRVLTVNPNEALQVIRMANQEAARHGSATHIEMRGNHAVIEDNYRHIAVDAGQLRFDNCYGNSVYDRQPPPCNQPYERPQPYAQQPYEQPYPQPYEQPYPPQRDGISTGAAVGIGILSGVLLDRALGGGRHFVPRERPRW